VVAAERTSLFIVRVYPKPSNPSNFRCGVPSLRLDAGSVSAAQVAAALTDSASSAVGFVRRDGAESGGAVSAGAGAVRRARAPWTWPFPLYDEFHVWQIGHQNKFRPSSTAVRMEVPHTRHGSPARR
jgi:hypothetical protein